MAIKDYWEAAKLTVASYKPILNEVRNVRMEGNREPVPTYRSLINDYRGELAEASYDRQMRDKELEDSFELPGAVPLTDDRLKEILDNPYQKAIQALRDATGKGHEEAANALLSVDSSVWRARTTPEFDEALNRLLGADNGGLTEGDYRHFEHLKALKHPEHQTSPVVENKLNRPEDTVGEPSKVSPLGSLWSDVFTKEYEDMMSAQRTQKAQEPQLPSQTDAGQYPGAKAAKENTRDHGRSR